MLRKNESIRIDGVLGVPLPAKQHKDLGPHHLGRHLYLLGAGSVAPAPPLPTPNFITFLYMFTEELEQNLLTN